VTAHAVLRAERTAALDTRSAGSGAAREAPMIEAGAARARAERLVARGEHDLAHGNVAQARQFFLHAANIGLARAALLLGATYDAHRLARMPALGIQPNAAMAHAWYQRARELGASEADERLAGLVGR
jgi:TPR repeat protein